MSSDQRLLIDSDAYTLLSGCDLLTDAIDVLGYKPEQVLRLAALPHMLGKSKPMKNRYPPDVLTKAGVACGSTAALTTREEDAVLFGRLVAAHDDINGGEALMLAIAAENPQYRILTGDRRALVAFGQAPGIEDIRASLHGRLICLEIVLRLLAEKLGVAELSAHLAPMISRHQSLKVFFSPACQADHAQCFDALNSYFMTLGAEVGVALLLNPFGGVAVAVTEIDVVLQVDAENPDLQQ